MGISKEFRKGLKYRVASAKCKTLESLLSVKFNRDLGMSETGFIGDMACKACNQIYLSQTL